MLFEAAIAARLQHQRCVFQPFFTLKQNFNNKKTIKNSQSSGQYSLYVMLSLSKHLSLLNLKY